MFHPAQLSLPTLHLELDYVHTNSTPRNHAKLSRSRESGMEDAIEYTLRDYFITLTKSQLGSFFTDYVQIQTRTIIAIAHQKTFSFESKFKCDEAVGRFPLAFTDLSVFQIVIQTISHKVTEHVSKGLR